MSAKRGTIVIALITAAILVVACNRQRQPANEGNVQMTNFELKNRIRAKLDSDPGIKAADLRVDTDAEKKQVTLFGTVKSEDTRQRAVSLAQSAVPGINVADKITVQPQELARTTPKHAKRSAHVTRKSTKAGTRQ